MTSDRNPSAADAGARAAPGHAGLLGALDFSVLQQCMHCGMCLPTCPTYAATKLERHSPRGRITLMREIAEGRLEVSAAFGDEMYYCLGCLACVTACPAGVDYPTLFETARAEVEERGVLAAPKRDFIRRAVLRGLFTRPRLLRLVGRLLWLWRASGARWVFRSLRLNRLLPAYWRGLEAQAPDGRARFSHQLIAPVERPAHRPAAAAPLRRVALLTGCVQDILLAEINRDTADVLLAADCEVHTPPVQPCCGSLHAHNGDLATARQLARRQLDLFDPAQFDAIISNAGGCGSHLRHYGKLLATDAAYRDRAHQWDAKVRDVHEWLVEIGWKPPPLPAAPGGVTYHDSCHLCHGQHVAAQPRALLQAACGPAYRELGEAAWCCGSAGIYNLTHPATSADLLRRKMGHVRATGAATVATGNPGCHLQLQHGARQHGLDVRVEHPVSLLARAVRAAAAQR
jgi:glycolate oxidase iron-sulfur subunit